MSSDYRAKTGSSVALVSLTVLSPQPRSEGIKATRRTSLGDGSILDEGLYVELVWDVLEQASDVITLLTVFGLNSAKSTNVTIYARDDQYTYARYNGVAIRPEPSWNNYFARNVIITVRNLVAL